MASAEELLVRIDAETEKLRRELRSLDLAEISVVHAFPAYQGTAVEARGDPEQRWQAHQIAVRNQILTPNEVRRVEGWNPRDGGDRVVDPNATASEGA